VRGAIGAKLEATSALVEGGAAAREVWATLGPKADGQPVEMDKMEAEVRRRYANDPLRAKAAVDNLRELQTAQTFAEKERLTGNVNKAYSYLNAGMPLSKVRLTPEFQALPAHEQDRIAYEQTTRQHAAIRAGADDEQRQLAHLQRQDMLLKIKNWDDYMRLQNPELLSRMTRNEVMASQRIVGRAGTEDVLKKWDALQKPGGLAEAHLDNDQFNAAAQRAGMSPNKKGLSETEKDLLVRARDAVESAIRQEQTDKKRQLTADERTAVINREFGRTVIVHRTLLPNQVKPLLATTPSEREDLVLPQKVRERAAGLMQRLHQSATTDAARQRYAPTPANLSRFVTENPELLDAR